MTELTLYGRGGQGGVTLAKLIATAYFQRGKYVQAFGVYAAERSGAPLQAYVRIDDDEITNHNQITQPDGVIVLDRTLISPRILAGLKPNGWIVLNAPDPPDEFAEMFPGRVVATVPATAIAVENGLGTRTVPIINTTLLGAVGRVMGLEPSDIEAALGHVKFGGANVTAARRAFEEVRIAAMPDRESHLSGGASDLPDSNRSATEPKRGVQGSASPLSVATMFDDAVGAMPLVRTGAWATRQPQRRTLTPPCNHACPAGNDVQAFIAAMGRGACDEALSILLETSPFPGVCGRVCPAPCMDACNRAQFDEAVNVRDLERYAADHGRKPRAARPHRDERIAVVGGGPAGLSAAYHLARLGYPVVLFDAGDEPGGVMRTGIPAYRLPREVLDAEIEFILRHGVDVKIGRKIRREELLVLTHEFAAVFVATGLQECRTLNLGRLAHDLVLEGIDFLDRIRRDPHDGTLAAGKRVVVIGGGNTAVDAARSALRGGARSVRIVYRRTRAEMPAIREEIEEALDEGIALDELVMPLRLFRDDAGAMLTCTRMRLGEPDASGRPQPIPDISEGAQFDIRCDRVILALGQSADLSILPEGSEVHDAGSLLGLTGAPVFAGGDFATNDGTVSAAIGSGRKAAWHIHRTLSGEDLFTPEPPVATPEAVTMHVFSHAPRMRGLMLPPEQRRRTFEEVRLGLLDEPCRHPAAIEAQRCFSCGVCNACDRCRVWCPEGILTRDGDGYRFDYEFCKGCGICATACPRGVIFMEEL